MKRLAIRAIAVLAFSLPLASEPTHAAAPQAATGEAVTTSIGDAYRAEKWIADLYEGVKPAEPAALSTGAAERCKRT